MKKVINYFFFSSFSPVSKFLALPLALPTWSTIPIPSGFPFPPSAGFVCELWLAEAASKPRPSFVFCFAAFPWFAAVLWGSRWCRFLESAAWPWDDWSFFESGRVCWDCGSEDSCNCDDEYEKGLVRLDKFEAWDLSRELAVREVDGRMNIVGIHARDGIFQFYRGRRTKDSWRHQCVVGIISSVGSFQKYICSESLRATTQ